MSDKVMVKIVILELISHCFWLNSFQEIYDTNITPEREWLTIPILEKLMPKEVSKIRIKSIYESSLIIDKYSL